ncbi:ABC transporter ATP-binding protein [Paenibacillus sp. FSL R7-0179]|uniref:ABC transporter ATP-binding protein n=1 Tax=Paenibacillus sp. FSL R7-0179 TaxID=2921672 RepID=UPI0030F9792B
MKDVSLIIAEGEFTTIMGSSGSGKSTLLYIMSGMEYPTSGTVHLSGRDLNKLSDRQKSKIRQSEIGFVFQNYNLVQNLTVEENIELPVLLAGRKRSTAASRLEELLELLALTEHRRKLPAQLSGGQQQRVAIARAVINNPPLILADEPTGNLDTASAVQVMEMLQQLNRIWQTSIVHITHNAELIGYGTRNIVVKDGQLVSDTLLAADSRIAIVGNS